MFRFNFRRSAAFLGGLTLLAAASTPGYAQTPAPEATAGPTTQPASNDPQAVRLTFLGNQIVADESAIAALNDALHWAGYHVDSAGGKASRAAYDNKRMDRNGGGPVPWDLFYGRTARSFITHDIWHQPHAVPRPSQFNYIYRGNNQQIEAAKAEIAAMTKKIDVLLTRRRQLEAEQSALWATIAFESVGNHDIPLRPLYREQLAATTDNAPGKARAAALRAAVLYLRTLDHALSAIADTLEKNQEAAYLTLRDTLAKAQQRLQEAAIQFNDSPGMDGGQSEQAKTMMDVLAQAKHIQALCKDMCEAYRKAIEADLAAEDQRKLLYRGTLQESLFSFAEAASQFDETLTKLAPGWDIVPRSGTHSEDSLPAITTPAPAPAPAPGSGTPGIAPGSAAPLPGNTSANNHAPALPVSPELGADAGAMGVNILETMSGAPDQMKDGELTLRKRIQTIKGYSPPIAFRIVAKLDSTNLRIAYAADQIIFNWELDQDQLRIDGGPAGKRNKQGAGHLTPGEWHAIDLVVLPKSMSIYVDGQQRYYTDADFSKVHQPLGLFSHRSIVHLKSVTVEAPPNDGRDPFLGHAASPTATPEANPVAQATAAANPASRDVDLLHGLDVGKSRISGIWSLSNGTLMSGTDRPAKFQFYYQPPEEYDYRVVFTRTHGDDTITQMFVADGKPFVWKMGDVGNKCFAISPLGSGDHNESVIRVEPALETGHTYTSVVKVRRSRIETYLDGRLVTSLAVGNFKVKKSNWALDRQDVVGIGSWNSNITFAAVDVTEITGQGRWVP